MTRDYKDTARPARRSGNGRTAPLLVGMMIGLLLGVGIAAGVAVYVSKMPNPFSQKPPAKTEPRAKADTGAPGTLNPSPVEPGGDSKDAAKEGEKPRFTFYEDLPKGNAPAPEQGKPKVPKPAAKPAPAAAAGAPATTPAPGPAAKPGSGPATSLASAVAAARTGDPQQPADSEAKPDFIWYLQAGAYQTQADADNQKAAIALLGLDARVRTADTPDKGRVYRVRLGPFNTQDEANSVIDRLKENKITAALIKVNKNAPPKASAKPAPAPAPAASPAN